MAPYNMSFTEDSTGPLQWLAGVNTETGSLLAIGILVATFIISYWTLKGYSTDAAMTVSAFFTSIIATLLFFMGWIGDYTLLVVIVILIIMIFIVIASKD